jgi:hypothetical protein
MYESFVRYQTRLIRALDSMAKKYNFTVLDASQPASAIFAELQGLVSSLQLQEVKNGQERRPRRVVRTNGGL